MVEVFVAKRAYIADVIKDDFCELGFLLSEGVDDVDETEVEDIVLQEPNTIFVEAESATLPTELGPVSHRVSRQRSQQTTSPKILQPLGSRSPPLHRRQKSRIAA